MERVINTRSPFFTQLTSPAVTVNCNIKIWTGNKISDKPTDVTYALSKETSSGAATFEVAELLRDYLAHTSTLTSGYAWAEIVLTDGTTTSTTNYFVTEGYGLYDEGMQTMLTATGAHRPFFTTNTIYVAQGQSTSIPFYAGSTPLQSTYQIFQNGVGQGVTNFTDSSLSNTQVTYVTIDDNTTKVEFTPSGGAKQTFNVKTFRCSKFEPMLLTYVNKFGAKVQQWFTLLSKTQLNTSSDEFQRSLVNYNTLNAGNQLHTFRKRITGSKESFTLNADYVEESDVDAFEELFLSEYVWLTIGGANAIPVNVKTSSMEKKKHVNDKLIQYSFDVETASNYINTVR